MIRIALLVTCALVLGLTGPAFAGERARSWRFTTAQGVVRVYVPAGFAPETAATVIYLHGYYVDVDRAWETLELRRAFANANLDAVFIACEAPEGASEPTAWRDLGWLLSTVERELDLAVPRRVVAIAHGGGARAVRPWLRAPELATLVLVDAAYVDTSAHYRWSRARDHRLIELAARDHWRSRIARRLLPGAAVVDDLDRAEVRAARRVYVRAPAARLVVREVLPGVLDALDVPRLDPEQLARAGAPPVRELRTGTRPSRARASRCAPVAQAPVEDRVRRCCRAASRPHAGSCAPSRAESVTVTSGARTGARTAARTAARTGA